LIRLALRVADLGAPAQRLDRSAHAALRALRRFDRAQDLEDARLLGRQVDLAAGGVGRLLCRLGRALGASPAARLDAGGLGRLAASVIRAAGGGEDHQCDDDR